MIARTLAAAAVLLGLSLAPTQARGDINGCGQISHVGPGIYRFGIEVIADPRSGSIDYGFDCGTVGGTHLRGWQGTVAFRSIGDCNSQHLSSLVIGGVVFPINQKLLGNGSETLFVRYILPWPVPMNGNIFRLNSDVDRIGNCDITVEFQGIVMTEEGAST